MQYHPIQIGDNKVRFALVQEGHRTLFVIGLNPSTADKSKSDRTMQATMRIAQYNGYDGFIMFNLYPLRATNPKDLPKEFDKELHERNLAEIDILLQNLQNVDVWLAFGAYANNRKYLLQCFKDIVKVFEQHNAHWYYINELTKSGFPPHPLYQKTSLFKQFQFCFFHSNS